MNNGVNSNNTSSSEQSVLQPMAGVTVAPANPNPVNASVTSVPSQNQVQSITPVSGPQVSSIVSQTTQSVPVTPQPVPAVPTSSPTPQTPLESVTSNNSSVPIDGSSVGDNQPKKKKRTILPLLLFIIIGMGVYIYYITNSYRTQINQINYNCTPITSSKDEVKLDVNSTLVQDLYLKVATNIREDLAEPQFNDSMRLYLAYRQILETSKYDTDCKYYSPFAMEPFTCEVSSRFVPKAFREESLVREIKKLYGESTVLTLDNIQLGRSCIGGYQYIPDRHEYIQGFCNQETATSFTVDKTIVEAVSTRNTIILKEEVKYHENEKMSLPDSLRNGFYYYTFRLDMNYNYVLVSKTYESKYY